MQKFDLKAHTVIQLLELQSSVLDELCARNVLRSRNNPTGDYAEWLVSERLGLKLVQKSSKGYDAVDTEGRKFQIKGRRAGSALKAPLLGTIRDYESGAFDFLIAVVFDLDWSVRCAAKIAHSDLKEFLTFRKHVNGHNMRLNSTMFGDQRIADITSTLRS
jgi:hypothetical protein